jgi:hypothetical protein
MLKEIVDNDLGYNLKEVRAMNKIIRDNNEACRSLPDYEDTDRIKARKAHEKTEKVKKYRTIDAFN